MTRQAKQSCGQKNRTFRFETLRHAQGGALSLSPLKMALIAAEKESPSRPPRQPRDPNEQLALQLIERMKMEYKKRFPISALRVEPIQQGLNERSSEMADNDAR